MSSTIFLEQAGRLTRLSDTPYLNENLMQTLVAQYPELLAGDLIDPENPRRWLLLDREVGVKEREAGGSRWSIDHLLLDQDGIPTLVETKRATDTRLRREVAGQMLDYAANAVLWTLEELQERFLARCRAEGLDTAEQLAGLIGLDADPAAYWQQVKTNLQAGRLRLVFVADEMPEQLARIIEFMNKQMDPAEVLGVELRQYLAEGVRTIVPRLYGRTVEAEARKGVEAARRAAGLLTPAGAVEQLRATCGEAAALLGQGLIDWAEQRGLKVDTRVAPHPSLLLRQPGERSALLSISAYPTAARLFLVIPGWQQAGLDAAAIAGLKAAVGAIHGLAGPPTGDPKYPFTTVSTAADGAQIAAAIGQHLDQVLRSEPDKPAG